MPTPPLRIACFEPWLGGSHRSFLDEWSKRSRHQIQIFGLAPRHWKWRQEASAWELARKIDPGEGPPDLLFCSDYVDLPRLVGFLPGPWRTVRTLAYFHENQLTYPIAEGARPDHGPGFSNILTAIRTDGLIFNSEFHRTAFGDAAKELLRRLPSPNPKGELAKAIEEASVIPPAPDLSGVPLGRGGADGGPLRVLFPHRLEADKDPVAFCHAIREAARSGAEIEAVITGSARASLAGALRPDVADALESIAHWTAPDSGYAEARGTYTELLGRVDVVASTARHEFFGIAFTEAMAAGCTPLAPARLSYPGLLARWAGSEEDPGGLFSSKEELAGRLIRLASTRDRIRRPEARIAARAAVLPFDAAAAVPALDNLASRVATNPRHPQG